MARLQNAQYQTKNLARAIRCWLIPYLQSRYHGKGFRPLVSYLFTDWKCNVDCHYCWARDNRRAGMTPETAKQSIDFLKSVGCRAVAFMGGEPLVRRKFVLEVTDYATQNGFFVYLPTNGVLLKENVIDEIGSAGVAAINLAVDCVSEKPGLPKNLERIEPQFRYLVAQQKKYGFLLFFNINITSKNIEDARLLTEIAHDSGIATDYHINEPHIIERGHYEHRGSDLWVTPKEWEAVDDLLDWLIEANKNGYVMVNSVEHLEAMKGFMRMETEPWECRAGQNSIFIGINGEIAPCFGQYESGDNWGTIHDYQYQPERLNALKKTCNQSCLSTCNFTLKDYYQPLAVHKWIFKHIGLRPA